MSQRWSESNVLGCYASSIVNGRVYKIPKLFGKRIHVWGLFAKLLPQKFQFCKLGDIRAIPRPWADYSTKSDEFREEFVLQGYNSSTPWIEHEIVTLLQKLDWNLYGWCKLSYRRKTKISSTMGGRCTICLDNNASEAAVIKLQMQRNRGGWIIKFIDDLLKKVLMQSTEFTCPQTQKRILADSVYAIIIYQSLRWKYAL